jgi:uncharacterized protein (TIGR03435 family)
MANRSALALVVAVFAGAITGAQAPVSGPPAFEVVSIKQNNDNGASSGFSFSPSGRFGWNRMTLSTLLQNAFSDVHPRQILGVPDWGRALRFDVAATSSDALKELGPGGEPVGIVARLRTALEDRFALRAHVEQRGMDVYILEAVSAPLAAGAGLRRVDVDCSATTRALAQGAQPRPARGPRTGSCRRAHCRRASARCAAAPSR